LQVGRFEFRWLILAPLTLLCGCSSTAELQERAAPRDLSVDFSGSWELNYSRSDNLNNKLESIYKDLRRQAERRARSGSSELSRRGSAGAASADVSRSMSTIVPLAQMADYITTSQVIEIEQSETDIFVDREDTFALTCNFSEYASEVVTDDLGSEWCGWDAHQMLFKVALPEGTSIRHRMTVAPDGQQLQITTTVYRDKGRSFTLNRIYSRFEPVPPGFECEYTLSRGNVCSRSGS